MRREEREPREYTPEGPIIEADSIKKGLERLSVDRVEDTLLAESGDSSAVIERFRGGRSEYDARTLASVLGVPIEQVATASKVLLEIGFLEAIGENFKIPALYRDGLGVTQGKAF